MSVYVHALPGRLRVRSPRLRGAAASGEARTLLTAIAGVGSVTANPVCGSLLIEYDRGRVSPEALWRPLARLGFVPAAMPSGDPGGDRSSDPFWDRVAANVGAELLTRALVACLF